jgi:hypothetical protein
MVEIEIMRDTLSHELSQAEVSADDCPETSLTQKFGNDKDQDRAAKSTAEEQVEN